MVIGEVRGEFGSILDRDAQAGARSAMSAMPDSPVEETPEAMAIQPGVVPVGYKSVPTGPASPVSVGQIGPDPA